MSAFERLPLSCLPACSVHPCYQRF